MAFEQDQTYTFSFTGAGPFPAETQKLARVWLECQSWDATYKLAIQDNLTDSPSASTCKRTSSELVKRLSTLSEDELNLLASASGDDRLTLVWAAYVRTYPLIRDFAGLCLVPRWDTGARTINRPVIDGFLEGQLTTHPELEKRLNAKERNVTKRIGCALRSLRLANRAGAITPLVPSAAVMATICRHDPEFYLLIPGGRSLA